MAVALAPSGQADRVVAGPSPHAEPMDGAFSSSSRAGAAVFRAAGLEPGATIDGTVLVTNEGASRGMFWLSRTGFSDRQGPAGGTLSERLQVSVLDVTAADAPRLVYTGGLTQMGARPLGFLAAGKSRIYSVAATLLPDRARRVSAAGNPYEGSSTTISLQWRAIAGEPPTAPDATNPEAPKADEQPPAPSTPKPEAPKADKQPPAPSTPKPEAPKADERPPAPDATKPEAPKADERPPRLRLDIPGRQRLFDTGSLVVNARCDEACRLQATGRLHGVRRPSAPATVTRRAKAGEPTALRVTFGPIARQAMRDALLAGRPVPLRFTVVARDPAANRAATSRRIWLRPSS